MVCTHVVGSAQKNGIYKLLFRGGVCVLFKSFHAFGVV